MFCSKCGKQLPNDAVFCAECGARVSGGAAHTAQTPVPSAQDILLKQIQEEKMLLRQSEISALNEVREHFSNKQDAFDEYDKVTERLIYFSRGAKSSIIVWGAIIATISLFAMAIEAVWVGLLLFLIPGAAMICGGILMKINNRKKFNQYLRSYKLVLDELYDHYMQYPNCPIGFEYCNPETIDRILTVMNSGRADTVKEAVNLILNNRVKKRCAIHTKSCVAASKDQRVIIPARLFK